MSQQDSSQHQAEVALPLKGGEGNGEDKINLAIAGLFNTPEGVFVLDWLRAEFFNHLCGPHVEALALAHYEGQRFVVGSILARIEKGKNYGRTTEPRRSGTSRRPARR